jgi:hypothetical protein
MKKWIALVLALAFACLPKTASAVVVSCIQMIGPGAASNGVGCQAGTCDGTADSTTKAADVSKAAFLRVQLSCLNACTNVISIYTRSRPSPALPNGAVMPWMLYGSCTNVGANSVCADGSKAYYNVPVTMDVMIQQSGSGGGQAVATLEQHQYS